MKRSIFLLGICLGIFFQANAQNKAESLVQDTTLKFPQITFVSTSYNFGVIRKGEKFTTSFYFKNTGTKPLQILLVQTSCGCTVSEWSKTPIEPNATGEINVVFDSAAKENLKGKQKKILLVYSNAIQKEVKLSLEGEIL
jgi:hypothetical protein